MNAGVQLERILCAQHDLYRARGWADIVQVPTPFSVLGRTTPDARGRTVFRGAMAARAGVDFVGWVWSGRAVPVLAEAKAHSGSGAWSMDAVLPQQAEQLDRGVLAGVISVVLLHAWGRLWVCEWARLRGHETATGRRTVRPSEAEAVGQPANGYDWLVWWR
jgi:penicillin-binding protein-related factor A (putative recombinase)